MTLEIVIAFFCSDHLQALLQSHRHPIHIALMATHFRRFRPTSSEGQMRTLCCGWAGRNEKKMGL